MSIPVCDFDPVRIAQGYVFPDAIESDAWTMFHGTSLSNAPSIEASGFSTSQVLFTAEEVAAVVRIYKWMDWSGESSSGYAVLEPFSHNYDFARPAEPLQFFWHVSHKAVRWATRDFAGGEKCRAMRNAIRDLQRYVDDPEVRARHGAQLEAECRRTGRLERNGRSLNPSECAVDLHELADRIAGLAELRARADAPFDGYRGGVVYAFRIGPEGLGSLSWNNSMGIQTAARVPSSLIAAKVLIPTDYEKPLVSVTDCELARLTTGLIPALMIKGTDR